jgi:hypothetical protein
MKRRILANPEALLSLIVTAFDTVHERADPGPVHDAWKLVVFSLVAQWIDEHTVQIVEV